MKLEMFVLAVVFFAVSVKSARILGFFHYPSISHLSVYQAVYKELSLRGHEVVVVTPRPINDDTLTNLTEIDVSYVLKEQMPVFDISGYQDFFVKLYYEYGYRLAEMILQDDRVNSLCSSDGEMFDIVMVESYYPIWYKFGARCKANLIAISSTDAMMSTHNAQGNPLHPALFGGMVLDYSEPLSLWKKIQYTYYFIWYNWFHKKYVLATSDYLIDKYVNKSLPKAEDLEKNISLLLLNSNFIISPVRPLVPSTILLGFVHIKDENAPSNLPEENPKNEDNLDGGGVAN